MTDSNRGLNGSGGNQLSKSFSRSQFRRSQPPVSNAGSSKQECSGNGALGRRSQKGRGNSVDKRPRPRSLGESEQLTQKQEPPEFGSLQSPGSKKQNLSHLLNFHFAPREHHRTSSQEFNRAYGRGNNQGNIAKNSRPKYWKESFIQANCQFLVKGENGNYESHKYDPDHLVGWDSIEQIVIRTYGGMPNCPICLEPYPCAAKMTKCGHIFCWPCCYGLAFHLEGNTQPCPICFEPIKLGDLKSVVANLCEDFHVGDELEFQLMCRPKDSSEFEKPVSDDEINWERRFKKLLVVNKDKVFSEILAREEAELSQRFSEDMESLEAQFVTSAMDELKNRKLVLNNNLQPCEIEKLEDDRGIPESVPTASDDSVKDYQPIDWNSYFIFYQAADGRYAYINQMNMAMLWKSMGENPLNWPQRLQLKVLEVEYHTMTTELRKRLKFLQHVPLNTCIQIVEVELGQSLVSEQVLKDFTPQLEQRKKRRAERIKLEKRHERQQAEADKRGQQPRAKILNTSEDFPIPSFAAAGSIYLKQFSSEEEEIELAIAESLKESEDMDKSFSGDIKSSCSKNQASGTASSADSGLVVGDSNMPMLSAPGPSGVQTPTKNTYLEVARAWAENRNIQGLKPTTSTHGQGAAVRQKVSETSVGGDVDEQAVPEYRTSVSNAIAKALEDLKLGDGQSSSGCDTQTGHGRKKNGRKNKKNSRVLFATGMDMANQ